jgi:hypothetical protein
LSFNLCNLKLKPITEQIGTKFDNFELISAFIFKPYS